MLPRGTETTTVTERNGSLVKWLRRRPLKAESRVQFPYELLFRKAFRGIRSVFFMAKARKEILDLNRILFGQMQKQQEI